MNDLRLRDRADLSVYYDADVLRYDPAWIQARGITREYFMDYYKDCPSLGFEMHGRPIGGLLFDRYRANEIHFAVLPQYHGLWQPLWEPALEWALRRYDPIYACVEPFNQKCLRFLECRGWEKVGKDSDECTIYRMTARQLLAVPA